MIILLTDYDVTLPPDTAAAPLVVELRITYG